LGVTFPGDHSQKVLPARLKLPKIQPLAAYLIRGRPVCQAAGGLNGCPRSCPPKIVIEYQPCSEKVAAGFSRRRTGWNARAPRHKNFAKEKEFLVKGMNFAWLKLRHCAPVVESIIQEITNYEIEG